MYNCLVNVSVNVFISTEKKNNLKTLNLDPDLDNYFGESIDQVDLFSSLFYS